MHQISGVSATPMLTGMTAQSSVTAKEVLLAVLKIATATMDVRIPSGGPLWFVGWDADGGEGPNPYILLNFVKNNSSIHN